MTGVRGQRRPDGADGSSGGARSPLERPSALRGTDSPADVQRYLAALVATRVFHEEPAALVREVTLEQGADAAEELQEASLHRDPGVFRGKGAKPARLNRQLRRARGRKKRIAKVVEAVIAKARAEGDPHWKPEAFPTLDWSIQREVWALMRDPTGRKARIFAAALPPAQADELITEAVMIARAAPQIDPYASPRWRELVAAAWASWRLSRPVKARSKTVDDEHTRLGDYVLGNVPPDPAGLRPPVKRENPWAGGRVVDGYARQAFCLLIRDLRTGQPLSMSKLFQVNGSGELGAVKYLSGKLYTRYQPRADRSRYVGPVKRGPDGRVLLDKHGRPQRYALAQHWYHASMCGRRTAVAADRGQRAAGSVLRTLCPWLFKDEPPPGALLEELSAHAAEVEGGGDHDAPLASADGASATDASSREAPD